MKIRYSILLAINTAFLFSCGSDEVEEVKHDTTPYVLEYGSFPTPDISADNLLTVEGVKLGRMLFYEKKMSKDNTISCASCHKQVEGFSDANVFSLGVENRVGKRQAMPIFNMAWHSNGFFWDGRAPLLRNQALLPIQDHLEMDETLENVVSKLSGQKLYRNQFIRAFGSEEITSLKVSLALEQFMHSIVSHSSKYDQYLAGKVTLTASEERGRYLYFTEYNPFFPELSGADCAHCHGGINLENDDYMNNGLDADADFRDIGREMVTGRREDRAKFKVPSLRNIEWTAPYMHDGRFKTLEDVVQHYNQGIKSSTTVDPAILFTKDTGLFLDEKDIQDLIAFLKTLSDPSLKTNEAFKDPFL
ncbi:MAG: cytochrome c peroxidase [Saprospiraceae bacterium]